MSLRAAELGAAIVYEQWGWPLSAHGQAAVRERFAGVPVVVDRVDSADFFFSEEVKFGEFDVLSLSKGLGIAAGGVARHGSAVLQFEPYEPVRRGPPGDHLAHPAVRELFKQSGHVHPGVLDWLRDNCAVTALEAERRARNAAARLIFESQFGAAWPVWMANAIASGAGPVWAPVLRGGPPAVHRQVIASLASSCGIQAAVRIFNWTGNPLCPVYEPALALPIHGGVQCPAEIIAAMSSGRLHGRMS